MRSLWDDDGTRRARERREKEDGYRNDVSWAVYRAGLNVDRIDYDRVSEAYRDGCSPDEAARREIDLQRRRTEEARRRREDEQRERDWLEQQERQAQQDERDLEDLGREIGQ